MKEGISLSAAFILSPFALACACSYLTVIEECCPIRLFLIRKRLDFPDLEQVVPSSMADAVRKETCNNSKEETVHVSVSLPGLFGLAIIKTLECKLRSRVYSGLSLVKLNKKIQRHWMGTRENKNFCKCIPPPLYMNCTLRQAPLYFIYFTVLFN